MLKLIILIIIVNIKKIIFYNNFLKTIILYNLDNFIIIFILCIIFLIYINIIYCIDRKIYSIFGRYTNLYIHNYYDLYSSLLVFILFFFYYVIYIRILNIFFIKNTSLNIFSLKNNLVLYSYDNLYFIIILLFFVMILYLVLFVFFRFFMFFFKKHYLKLHYFIFCRSYYYNKIILITKEFETYLYLKVGSDLYFFYTYIRFYFFHLLILILFIQSLINESGNLKKILIILPYYSFYYFLYNIHNFIITKNIHDFDILIMESYYKEINYEMEKNEEKKILYKRFLLLNDTKFEFIDSIYFDFKDNIKFNAIMLQTYKYTKNSYPNDFFTKIKKTRPKFK